MREQLLTACAGYAVEIGGIWYLHAGAAAMPILVLDEDDLRGPMVTVPKRSMRDRFNGVRATFVNPDNAWQPGDAPPLLDTVYVGQDGGEEIYTDIRLPFTTSARCAQRLMKIQLERNRQQRLVRYPAKLTAMGLRPIDGCYVSNVRYGWVSEQHIVMGWVLADDGGIDLSLQQDSASVYAWTADDEWYKDSLQSDFFYRVFMAHFDHIEVHVSDIPRYCSFLQAIFEGGSFEVISKTGTSMFTAVDGLRIEVKKKKGDELPQMYGFCNPCLRRMDPPTLISKLGLEVASIRETDMGPVYFFRDHEGVTWHIKDLPE